MRNEDLDLLRSAAADAKSTGDLIGYLRSRAGQLVEAAMRLSHPDSEESLDAIDDVRYDLLEIAVELNEQADSQLYKCQLQRVGANSAHANTSDQSADWPDADERAGIKALALKRVENGGNAFNAMREAALFYYLVQPEQMARLKSWADRNAEGWTE